MPQHGFSQIDGRLLENWVDAPSLRNNRLGDPARRLVRVYVPPDCESSSPLIVYLSSFTNSSLNMTGWKAFGENIPERVERLVKEGLMEPTVIAFPDCFTSLGGNQYIDSPITGNWETFLIDDLIPHLIGHYPISQDPKRRAVMGFSSGGYGALIQGMRHSSEWGAIACHSADMGFELLFPPEFPRVATALQNFDFSPRGFLDSFEQAPQVDNEHLQILFILAMAATYDPDPGTGNKIQLPFDLHTCEIIPERWGKWLEHDPIHILGSPESLQNLRRLRGLYFDCGNRDQYQLQFGARRFTKLLETHSINHRYEEFEGTHSNVQKRLDTSLPFLSKCLNT